MEIGGIWDPKLGKLLSELDVAHGKVRGYLEALPKGELRKAATQLDCDTFALFTFLVRYVRDAKPCSSQIAAGVLRMLIESAVSVFAFCQSPTDRAGLYLHYAAVYDWKFACLDEANIGCPIDRGEPSRAARILERKKKAAAALLPIAVDYIDKKRRTTQSVRDCAKQALVSGNEKPKWFRDTWYPESRREVLRQEGMEWVDDKLYKRLCSAVHSDSCASKVLEGIGRTNVFALALQFWGAALYRLVDTLGIRLTASHKGLLHMQQRFLRGETVGRRCSQRGDSTAGVAKRVSRTGKVSDRFAHQERR